MTSRLRVLSSRSVFRSAPVVLSRRVPAARPRSGLTVMAALTAYVKGIPETKTLGDCPFSHRVLLTLEAKGLSYEKEYIDFSNKPQWLVEQHAGKVPVIKDGDEWISDSDKIVVYLEEKYPIPSLKSNVPSELGSTFFGAFRGFLKATPEEEADKKSQFTAELKALDDYLAEHGPFFGGNSINATDAALAPKLYHAKVALAALKNFTFPEEFKAVSKYFESLQALPEWKNTDYGAEMIVKGWSSH